jgi:peptidoglycan hydrolase-like protein with peptidoglycan-binding domain
LQTKILAATVAGVSIAFRVSVSREPPEETTPMSILARGLCGEPVRVLQQKLGINADGVFGSGTEQALRDYQSQNGLVVDGLAGPDTFMQMGLHELLLLDQGTHGEAVKKLQAALGIGADGHFGPATAAAVRAFQHDKGLEVDGVAGPKTLAQMPGFEDVTPDKVEASVVTEATPPVDPAAVQAAAAEPRPPTGVIAKVEEKVAEVGKSIWNTIKRIF